MRVNAAVHTDHDGRFGAAGSVAWADAVDTALGKSMRLGMDIAFGARAVDEGSRLVIERLRGSRSNALNGLVVHRGSGVGGQAVARCRPVALEDYLTARTISHHYDLPVSVEGIHSIMAVPLMVSHRLGGVLYLGLRQRLGIGDRVQQAAVALAQDAARRIGEPRHAAGEAPSGSVQADLRSLIARIDDPGIRAELEDIDRRLTPPQAARPAPRVLSRREHEALVLVAVGLSNSEIAERMGLSSGTVKAYLRSTMRKLDCRNRISAVNAARSLGYPL